MYTCIHTYVHTYVHASSDIQQCYMYVIGTVTVATYIRTYVCMYRPIAIVCLDTDMCNIIHYSSPYVSSHTATCNWTRQWARCDCAVHKKDRAYYCSFHCTHSKCWMCKHPHSPLSIPCIEGAANCGLTLALCSWTQTVGAR